MHLSSYSKLVNDPHNASNLLASHVRSVRKAFDDGLIKAPFFPLLQGRGTGKTKTCLEALHLIPGMVINCNKDGLFAEWLVGEYSGLKTAQSVNNFCESLLSQLVSLVQSHPADLLDLSFKAADKIDVKRMEAENSMVGLLQNSKGALAARNRPVVAIVLDEFVGLCGVYNDRLKVSILQSLIKASMSYRLDFSFVLVLVDSTSKASTLLPHYSGGLPFNLSVGLSFNRPAMPDNWLTWISACISDSKSVLKQGRVLWEIMGDELTEEALIGKLMRFLTYGMEEDSNWMMSASLSILWARTPLRMVSIPTFAEDLVAHGLALVDSVSPDLRQFTVTFASEPVTAVAAAGLLRDHADKVFEDLARHLSLVYTHEGYMSELIAMWSMLATVDKITNYLPHLSIPLDSFLSSLLKVDLEWCKKLPVELQDAKIRLCQFAHVDFSINERTLKEALLNASGLACPDSYEGVDLIIPAVLSDGRISAVFFQVKKKAGRIGQVSEKLWRKACQILEPMGNPPSLGIALNLANLEGGESSAKPDVTPHAVVPMVNVAPFTIYQGNMWGDVEKMLPLLRAICNPVYVHSQAMIQAQLANSADADQADNIDSLHQVYASLSIQPMRVDGVDVLAMMVGPGLAKQILWIFRTYGLTLDPAKVISLIPGQYRKVSLLAEEDFQALIKLILAEIINVISNNQQVGPFLRRRLGEDCFDVGFESDPSRRDLFDKLKFMDNLQKSVQSSKWPIYVLHQLRLLMRDRKDGLLIQAMRSLFPVGRRPIGWNDDKIDAMLLAIDRYGVSRQDLWYADPTLPFATNTVPHTSMKRSPSDDQVGLTDAELAITITQTKWIPVIRPLLPESRWLGDENLIYVLAVAMNAISPGLFPENVLVEIGEMKMTME